MDITKQSQESGVKPEIGDIQFVNAPRARNTRGTFIFPSRIGRIIRLYNARDGAVREQGCSAMGNRSADRDALSQTSRHPKTSLPLFTFKSRNASFWRGVVAH